MRLDEQNIWPPPDRHWVTHAAVAYEFPYNQIGPRPSITNPLLPVDRLWNCQILQIRWFNNALRQINV